MNDLFFDIRDRVLVDSAGAASARHPELFYQENTVWRIFLRNGGNSVADLSGVAAWGAAAASDFCAGTPPMCRTLSRNISVDPAAGTVTVALDCATPEFLAAVNGSGVKPAWFELYGIDAAGKRMIDVQFEIRARMTLDPDPLVDSDTPDTVATKAYTSAAIDSANAAASAYTDRKILSGGYVNSSGAQTVASNAAVVTMLSGGQAAIGGVSAIKLWFESGFRADCYSDLVMSSKSLTLVSSDGGFVYRPDNDLWVSARIAGFGDISNTLNAPEVSAGFFATSSGSEIVVSAVGVTETFEDGPEDSAVIEGLVASSTDGGLTWTFGDAGIYWGTNGVEAEEDGVGRGWCYPEWGIGSCCGVELRSTAMSASGALLSNTEIDTVLGNYRLTYTSSGGLMISGGGVQLQVSSGGIVASAVHEFEDGMRVGPVLSMTSDGGVRVSTFNDTGDAGSRSMAVDINADGVVVSGASGDYTESVGLSGGGVAVNLAFNDEENNHSASVNIAPDSASIVQDSHSVVLYSEGVVVSGGGVALQISGGQIAASASSYDEESDITQAMAARLTSGGIIASGNGEISARVGEDEYQAHVTITSGGVSINTSDPTNDIGVSVVPGAVGISGSSGGDSGVAVNIDGRPAATQLVTSILTEPAVSISQIDGGEYYWCELVASSVEVTSVVKTTEASYLHFTLDSVTAPTPVVISGVSMLNRATFEGGKEYLVGFFDGMAVVNEVTSGGVLQ